MLDPLVGGGPAGVVEKNEGADLLAAGVVAPLAGCEPVFVFRPENNPPPEVGCCEALFPNMFEVVFEAGGGIVAVFEGVAVGAEAAGCDDAVLSAGCLPKLNPVLLGVVEAPPPPNSVEPPVEPPPKLKPLPLDVVLPPNTDGLLSPEAALLPKSPAPGDAGGFPVL